MVTAIGLWLDTIKNTAIALTSSHTALYNTLFIFTAAVRYFLPSPGSSLLIIFQCRL